MNLLIIEDDMFKFSKINNIVISKSENIKVKKIDNVHDAVIYLEKSIPDKIVLDMSLPTHKAMVGEGSPVSMPAGGIEIILELMSINIFYIPILILTQYSEIEIENEYFEIEKSGDIIKSLYHMKFLKVVYYQNESKLWELEVEKFLMEEH